MGSLIGDLEDVERRKQLSTAALNKLYHVWMKGNKLKTTTKIQLYKSLVKSILLYNCSTWAPTLTEEEKINAFHRKQLKKVLNIKFPVKITNKSLYKKCQEKPPLAANSKSPVEPLWAYSSQRQRHPCQQSNKSLLHPIWPQTKRTADNNSPNRTEQRSRTN